MLLMMQLMEKKSWKTHQLAAVLQLICWLIPESSLKPTDQQGITLNLQKVQWNQPEVLFGGFLHDSTGNMIDILLAKALSVFPTPKSPTDVC
jgi:hypothetical protein